MIPDIEKNHPDMIMPNEKASLYWYVQSHGKETDWTRTHSQQYAMSSKLNEKDLKAIKDCGKKDEELGMLTPHCVDFAEVKKEKGCLAELETLKKELEST